jgi:hypothetical protein
MSPITHGCPPAFRRARAALTVLALAALLAGCAGGGASQTPGRSPIHTFAPTAVPTVSPTSSPLPTVGPAPAGAWTGIRWINAGPAFPQVRLGGSETESTPTVFGWSRGFVGFAASPDSTVAVGPTVTPAASTDGLHWTLGDPLDNTGRQLASMPEAVVEGPAGLVAVGRGPAATCGGPPSADALWTSSDGLKWSRVPLPPDFATASVITVDGGATGYVAAGVLKDGLSQIVWLSQDGRAWHQIPLTRSVFGQFDVAGAVNFSGGYVVSGASHTEGGCGANMVTPSIWWSVDGASWARDALPGAIAATSDWVTVTRISDHALMAFSSEWNETTKAESQHVWVSSDGRAWKPIDAPSKMLTSNILSDRQRGLSLVDPYVVDHDKTFGPLLVAAVADDLSAATLTQTGDGPTLGPTMSGWISALGPTGVVVLTLDGTTLWLGVPTAA